MHASPPFIFGTGVDMFLPWGYLSQSLPPVNNQMNPSLDIMFCVIRPCHSTELVPWELMGVFAYIIQYGDFLLLSVHYKIGGCMLGNSAYHPRSV